MAVVQRVVGDAGANTDTFCRWLMSQKMEVGGPLSGICHWFVNPEKKLHRPRIGHFHPNRHLISNEIPDLAVNSEVKTDLMISGHLHESTSISIIMILATVLFILLITAFVTCITRKKRRAQSVETGTVQDYSGQLRGHRRSHHKDKPPDYDTAVKMKEREELELPSYSEAVSCVMPDIKICPQPPSSAPD